MLRPMPKDPFVRTLVAAADQSIVACGAQQTVIADYHWFSDWGRDPIIALRGLKLVTGRIDVAKSILLSFARHVDRGMLPNHFPDMGETPEYNTVDATLWFFKAVRELLQSTADYEFIHDHLYDVLADIIAWQVHGTRYGIRMDGDASHHPCGCMAQAWSVAELPRTAVEDVYGPNPTTREAMPASMTEA
jgi:predicted glycogen debranching enzyme